MKIMLLIFLFCSIGKNQAIEPIDLITEINKESLLIQKLSTESVKNKKIESFYENYFVDGKNIFAYTIDNFSNSLNCGFLNLKRPCYKSIYRIDEIKVSKNISCINLYGTHSGEPDLYIIQNTVLFVKNETLNKWMIVGNRVLSKGLQTVVYGLLNKYPFEDSFTNRCFNQERIKNWQLRMEEDIESNYDYSIEGPNSSISERAVDMQNLIFN